MNTSELNRFYPLCGHWDDHTLIDARGAVYAVFHLAGLASELVDAGAIEAARDGMNQLCVNEGNPRLKFWDHFTRIDRQAMTRLPEPDNWFVSSLDRDYRETVGSGLYRNDLFFTLVMEPKDTVGRGFKELLSAASTDYPSADNQLIRDFESVVGKIKKGLNRYGPRRLGMTPDGFSEPFEAFHVIANNGIRQIGASRPRMGLLVTPHRVVFGKYGHGHILDERDPKFFTILSLLRYPSGGLVAQDGRVRGGTRATMFDALRSKPFGVTITNSYEFAPRSKALDKIQRRLRQMTSGEDPSRNEFHGLINEEADVTEGHVAHGSHHCSFTIFGRTMEDLDKNVAEAEAALAEAGLTVTRETCGLKPAFYAQIPGNSRWRTRPTPLNSLAASAMAAKHNVPHGRPTSRWGPAIIGLRTTSDTEYPFHFHAQGSEQLPKEDQANVLIMGPGGSGKTAILGSVCLMTLRNPRARVVIADKDYGLSVAVKAAGGPYAPLVFGKPTGISLLGGLENTPEDIAFAVSDIRAKILSDNGGEISRDEDERLTRAVQLQMQKPPEARALGAVAVMLGQKRRPDGIDSAGRRLEKWCRGGRLGWVSDNERDEWDFTSSRLLGFETGDLFRDDLVCSAVLSNIFYRTRKLINGQPIVLAVDEMWRADKVPAFAEQNNDNLKTIRKNEGSVILATQSAVDALNSNYAHTFIQQIPTKIFFGDVDASGKIGYEALVQGMNLTRAEYLAVTKVLPTMKHTFLLKRPSGSVLCRFDLSGLPGKVAIISGRRSTFNLMNELIAEHGDDPRAWVPHFEKQAPLIVDNPMLAAA